MKIFAVRAIIFLVLFIGSFALQFYLSKREPKWPGRIIPILSFLFSLFVPLSYAVPQDGLSFGIIMQLLLATLLANIPTIIYAVIYLSCREKFRRRRQMDKMSIQDLD